MDEINKTINFAIEHFGFKGTLKDKSHEATSMRQRIGLYLHDELKVPTSFLCMLFGISRRGVFFLLQKERENLLLYADERIAYHTFVSELPTNKLT